MNAGSIPRNLLHKDEHTLATKLARFVQDGVGQLQIVFDFDRTLTVGRVGAEGDVTTWNILKGHLPEMGQQRYQALFEKYRELEVNGTMNAAHATEWWTSILDLFVEYRVDMNAVERDFLARASIRRATKELFDLCTEHKIPTIILSAGIKDVIDMWSRSYDVHPTIVLSTSLETDSENRVSGWNKNSMIHILNKHEVGHPELSKIRATHRNTLVIGDSINDADMAKGTDGVLRVRIHDPRTDESARLEEIRMQTFELFDATIEDGTLRPVCDLVRQIVG